MSLQAYQQTSLFFRKVPATAAKSLQSCPTLCDPRDGSPPGPTIAGILQARTRVGCHFLLQGMKVKSESEVAQSCPTLSDAVDCSPPGSSVHGVFQARVLEWVAACQLLVFGNFTAILAFVHLHLINDLGKSNILNSLILQVFIEHLESAKLWASLDTQ